jgi:hypothetical protein
MWPFKRHKDIDELDETSPEAQAFYADEPRDRVGLAWLLAIGSLLATVAVAGTLFFIGRWGYRTVAHNNAKAKTTASTKATKTTSSNTSVQHYCVKFERQHDLN